MFDRLRTALSDQNEDTRAWLKTNLESYVRELEDQLARLDRSQDPATSLNVDHRQSVRRYRDDLVDDLEYARSELRDLS